MLVLNNIIYLFLYFVLNIILVNDSMSTYKEWSFKSKIDINKKFKSDWKTKLLIVLEILFVRHPKNILCLNQILNGLDDFSPLPFEEVFYQLKNMLKKCNK